MLLHVPAGTYLHASPWRSRCAVPVQDDCAVWQSVLPALAIPSHCSTATVGGDAGSRCAMGGSGRRSAVAPAVTSRTWRGGRLFFLLRCRIEPSWGFSDAPFRHRAAHEREGSQTPPAH